MHLVGWKTLDKNNHDNIFRTSTSGKRSSGGARCHERGKKLRTVGTWGECVNDRQSGTGDVFDSCYTLPIGTMLLNNQRRY